MGHALALHGVLYYNDYSLPLSIQDALVNLSRFNSVWDGFAYFGHPNALFFGTQLYLYAYVAIGKIASLSIASKIIPLLLLFLGEASMFCVLSARFDAVASAAAAVLYVANPWTYDQLLQGHIYLLEILPLLPILASSLFLEARWGQRRWLITALSLAGVLMCDYHFAILFTGSGIYVAAVGVAAKSLDQKEFASRIVALALGVTLLGFFAVPYVATLRLIMQANAPGFGNLAYFSNVTSISDALTLLRPSMNAGQALFSMPNVFVYLWFVLATVPAAGALLLLVRRDLWPSRLWGVFTSLVVISVILGAGLNSPFVAVDRWFYTYIPLAAVFRDPSKFFIIPLVFYCFALPKLVSVAGDPHKWGAALARVALCSLVATLALPFLIVGNVAARAFSYSPAYASLSGAYQGVSQNQRVAFLPPWNFLKYPSHVPLESEPIHDPLVLYPRGPFAGIDYNYDNSLSNRFARWLFGQLYFEHTTEFGRLARMAGISRIIYRSGVNLVSGNAADSKIFSSFNAAASLAAQDDLRGLVSGATTTYHVRDAAIFRTVARVDSIGTSTLDVIDGLAQAGENFRNASVCFSNECPKGAPILSADFANSAFVGTGITGTLAGFRRGGFRTGGWVWAAAYGALLGESHLPYYSIRGGSGRAFFKGLMVGQTYRVYVRILRGPSAYAASMNCGTHKMSILIPSVPVGFQMKWVRFGAVKSSATSISCELMIASGQVAISNIELVDSRSGLNLPDILFLDPTDTTGSVHAKAMPQAGVYFDVEKIGKEGYGIYHVNSRVIGRKVYVLARTHGGRGLLRLDAGSGVPIPQGNQRWISLGVVRSPVVKLRNAGRISISVHLIAITNRLLPLDARASNALAVRQTSSIVPQTFQMTRPAILAWSEPEANVWRIDGRAPGGTLAGFGQLYRLGDGVHHVSNVLVIYYWVGAALSILSALALMFFLRGFAWAAKRT